MSEVVLTCGFPASGKSTVIEPYLAKGYKRLNRDLLGGTLDGIVQKLDYMLATGKPDVIIDNTYLTIDSRKPILDIAKKHGMSVRCLYLTTSLEDAAFNNCIRMVKKYGKVLPPEELKKSKDPNALPTAALFSARKEFEKPSTAEGFSSIELVPFKRVWDDTHINKALLLDFDGCLRVCKSGAHFPCSVDDVEILPRRTEVLKKYKDQGYRLLGVSNQSGIAKGDLTNEQAIACFDKTCELLGMEIEYAFCPHRVPPISCFCRKPGVALGVEFIMKYKLKPSDCIFVGDMTTDKTFATRCGFQFQDADQFFK